MESGRRNSGQACEERDEREEVFEANKVNGANGRWKESVWDREIKRKGEGETAIGERLKKRLLAGGWGREMYTPCACSYRLLVFSRSCPRHKHSNAPNNARHGRVKNLLVLLRRKGPRATGSAIVSAQVDRWGLARQ